MTRFAGTAVLFDVAVTVSPDGSPREEKMNERKVFVNKRNVGASAYMAARAAGLHPDAEVQVRSADYSGQQVALMDGDEYDVESVRDTGEFTVLTLARRVSNEP